MKRRTANGKSRDGRSKLSIINYQLSIPCSSSGFTLIEVLLASFIFMSVITIAVGSFTSQLTLQSSTEAQRNVQQAAQAIIETISRDARTIDTFEFRGPSCAPTSYRKCGRWLSFNPADAPGSSKRREYRFFAPQQELRLCDPGEGNSANCGTSLIDRTKVLVTDFRVEGTEVPAASVEQPFMVVTLSLETVSTGRAEDFASLTLKTMVSSRLFEKYR